MNFPLSDFHFLRPEWFIALLPLLLLLLLIRRYRRSQSGWQSVIPAHLYNHLIAGKAVAIRQAPLSLLGWGWLLAVLALAGPSWERLPQPVFQVQQGNVVLIDMSLSMRAADVSPDRLTRAKYKAIDLINAIDEGEMGLVAYAGDAFTISPLTTDAANLVTLLPSLSPEIMPVPGSDPYRGIEEAASLLTNAGYQQGNIYWITDGITLPQAQDLQTLISDLPFTVNVLGVGTEEGAPIRQLDGQLVKDRQGQIVIPKLTGKSLQTLASASGGVYQTLSADESDIRGLTRRQMLSADAEETDEKTSQDGDQWAELGPWMLLLLLPFAAYAFRRGVIFALLLTPLILVTPPPAIAQSLPVGSAQPTIPAKEQPATAWYQTPFLNADQEGLKEFNAENYQTATDTFRSPLWKGSAAYNAGNYDEALQQFSRSDSTEAVYNQGNALAQLGELDEAIARYDEVLSRDPEHADAKANKALLEQMKDQQERQEQEQQQEQQEQENQEQQDNGGQDQKNQDSQQNNNESSDSDENSQQQDNPADDSQQDAQSGQQDEEQSKEGSEQKAQQPPEPEQGEQESDQQQGQQPQEEQQQPDEQQAQQAQAQAQQGELTDEEKEKMQRLENLMKRIPDDPAFLLKRKMQLEAQQRRRQGPPSNRSEW